MGNDETPDEHTLETTDGEPPELSEETLEAIEESREQLERGEYVRLEGL